jgi:hypothetical protein
LPPSNCRTLACWSISRERVRDTPSLLLQLADQLGIRPGTVKHWWRAGLASGLRYNDKGEMLYHRPDPTSCTSGGAALIALTRRANRPASRIRWGTSPRSQGAVLAAFSADVDNRTVTGGRADIPDVGSAQFVCAQPGEQAGQNQRRSRPGQSVLAVAVNRLEQRGDRGLGKGAG